MPQKRIFIDTNIIIEAHRVGCWQAMCRRYEIETVEKCIEEALTGDWLDPRRVNIDRDELIAGMTAQHAVTQLELATFLIEHPECQGLDDGELHLLAYLYANGMLGEVLVLISTADKAAIVATGKLGGLDSLISLEELAIESGVQSKQVSLLANHYRRQWLDEVRVKIRLNVLQ